MKIITKETGYHIIPSNHEISMVRKTKNATDNCRTSKMADSDE